MKQLTCEMCGSTELIKQDGVFVCQSCGCRYSVEEEKKKTVRNTVNVDNSAFVQNSLANARRAKGNEDWEKAEKYYNVVELNDPNNIEADFYSSYSKAMLTLIDGDIYKRQAAFKVLFNCISVIDDHYDIKRNEENKEAIVSIAADLAKMLLSDFVFTQQENHYGVVVKTDGQETYNLFLNLIMEFHISVNNIQEIDNQPCFHEALINLYSVALCCDYINETNKSTIREWLAKELIEFKKSKIIVYWSEHAVEKIALEQERKDLTAKIENLNVEISSLHETKEEAQIKAKIKALQQKKSVLGLFDKKEKRILQKQIDDLVLGDLKKAKINRETVVSPIQTKINVAKARIAEIDDELTKER